MPYTIKQLIEKNKKAFDSGFFIESLNLSFILINKGLKQFVKDELKQETIEQKSKIAGLVSLIKKSLEEQPQLKTRISKKVLKDISLFNKLYKSVNKEIKFQFPEKKITETAQLGINCLVVLNTCLIKIKNNKVD